MLLMLIDEGACIFNEMCIVVEWEGPDRGILIDVFYEGIQFVLLDILISRQYMQQVTKLNVDSPLESTI